MSHHQSFSYVGTGLPVLNQYKARINYLFQGHLGSDASEAQTRDPWCRVKHSTTEQLRSLI